MPDATILDKIVAHKKGEVAARKADTPLADIRARAQSEPPARDFLGALRTPPGPMALIAEVKKASPSAGVIRADFDPVAIARIYDENGAACFSVLTDERFFQGHDSYLALVKTATTRPVLRKDFTVDAYQVYEARSLGADAVLLIAAVLSEAQIAEYAGIARELGMAALVEVHTDAEMAVASSVGAELVGINARDLARFVTDLSTVERLAPLAPTGALLVAESGIKTPADVARVRSAGASAILVGETLMRSDDIGAAVRTLLG